MHVTCSLLSNPRRQSPLIGMASAVAFAIGLFGAPQLAIADDTKTYPGIFCTPMEPGHLSGYSPVDGRLISHRDTQDQDYVYCPIIKNVPNNTTLKSVVVRTHLGTSGVAGTISCKLQAFRAKGDGTKIVEREKSQSGGGLKTITFGIFGDTLPALTDAADWYYYHLKCDMSNETSIIRYTVTEAGDRDEKYKAYPPSICRADEADSTASWYLGEGLLNAREVVTTGDSLSMVCPVITDSVNNLTATSFFDLRVNRATAGNPDVSCFVHSSGDFQSIASSRTVSVPSGQPLNVGVNLDLNTSVAFGRYGFRCTMPGRGDARIYSYRVREN